jgi:hypothetical protein
LNALKLLGALVAAAMLLPAGAHAATLTNAGGTLTYTASPGATSAVGFAEVGAPSTTVDVYRFLTNPNGPPDDDPITSVAATCMEDQNTADFITYRCTGVTNVVADTGDGSDQVDAGDASGEGTLLATIEIELDLGEGDDFAAGGQSDDTLNGGDGGDTLFLDGFGAGPAAGAGNDTGVGGAGNDAVFGGRGVDDVVGGEGDDALAGGPGDDNLAGEAGADSLAAGPGGDTLAGGDGNDTLTGECEGQPCPAPSGGDDVSGGDGLDLFRYESYTTDAVSITLDDVANDGVSGEGDDVDADVEDVVVTGPANATVRGSAVFNSLTTGAGTDTLNSQDGSPDRVSCGDGSDIANVDDVDVVNADCETVNRAATSYNEDNPPTVAWSAPASGSRLSTTAPNTLTAAANDDKGIARVDFLDDERTVCSDTTAPYTCDYRPQGDDVGRNTLVAIAVDTSGQTASAVRAVVVPRFAGRLSARTRPRRDTRAPYRFTTTGRLTLPTAVTPAQGCRGTVTVQIKAGRKTVSTRRVRLRSDCSYRSRVTFRIKRRLRPRTLRRSVRFGGNAVMAAKSAKRQTLRIR